MGSLKPNATIIYESPDGGDTVYARYKGETDRWIVGQNTRARSRIESIQEDRLWKDIRQSAESNKALQNALDRVKIIYELSKDNGNK